VEVLGEENQSEHAIPLDPLNPEPADQAKEAEENPEEQGSLRPRTRPLGFFAQEEDSPSFYLSLSDLMSLLLVFFVLIFSLTNPFAAPDGPSDTPKGVAQREAPIQMPEMVRLPDPKPLPAQMTKGIMAVAAAGSGDPGLMSESKPVAAGSRFSQTRRSTAGSSDAFLDKALLRLVTTSKPLAPEAVIKEESRLSELVAQMDAEVRAQTGPGVEVESRKDSLVVRLPEAITFDQGRAMIKPAMASVLGRLAEVLARRGGYKVFVTGHTDNVPIRNRDFASNWELSAARAAAVARALMAKGSNPSRFTISGQADQQPIASNATADGRQQNRRVEIELRPVG
jgi:chemotaxis protein MotB